MAKTKKVVPKTVDEAPFEHPDDKAFREKSEASARTVIDAFAETHRKELVDLVLTYADVEAERKLAALREAFWGVVVP